MPSFSMRAFVPDAARDPSFFASRVAARARVSGLRSFGGALTRSRAKLTLSAMALPARTAAVRPRVPLGAPRITAEPSAAPAALSLLYSA